MGPSNTGITVLGLILTSEEQGRLSQTSSRPGGRRAGPVKMGKDITVLGLTLTSDK